MHYEAQRRFSRRHRWLGGFATLLTTLVGATVVKEIGGASTDPRVRWGIGTAAALATVLTTLHTFLGYAARTASHRSTAAGYATVVRKIDEELTFGRSSLDDQRRVAESIRTSLDALSRDAPEVPARILAKYRRPSLALPPTVPVRWWQRLLTRSTEPPETSGGAAAFPGTAPKTGSEAPQKR
jgi:hypothetical protein